MRAYPPGVYARGGRLYVKVKREGKWEGIATGLSLVEDPDGKAAARLREKVQAQLDAGLAGPGPVTVARYAKRWMETRKTRGLVSFADDVSRMDTHVLPALGKMPMAEVKPRHIRAWVHKLKSGALAPRTVRNVYALASTMFRDAVIDEVIPATPCLLRRGDLPSIVDKDPEWRESAIFTKAEVEQVIGDTRIPWDRRVCAALMFLTGARFSEMAALRWRHFVTDTEPLGRILIAGAYSHRLKREKRTKSQVTRKVPVHPTLAAILAEWRLGGWAQYWGRAPTLDDLIVPSRESTDEHERHRNVNAAKNAFNHDLEVKLGWERRRQHDARRTFRSLLADAGGSERAIEWIVWGRKSSVSGRYDEPSWDALCEPVQKLVLRPRGAVGAVAKLSQDRDRDQPAESGQKPSKIVGRKSKA